MQNLIASTIQFPPGSGIAGFVYWLLGGIYGGVGSYALAVILFTLTLRVFMLPLDFGNRYFQRKMNSKMADLRPQLNMLRAQYGNDQMAMYRAQQQLYKKAGLNQGGSCFFMITSLVLTAVLFIFVFQALQQIGNYNLNLQFQELQSIHQEFTTPGTPEYDLGLDSEEFQEAILTTFEQTRQGFLWVSNIFRPDTWTNSVLTFDQFYRATRNVSGSVFAEEGVTRGQIEDQYAVIFDVIRPEYGGWNGLLLLVVLAGVVTYFSAVLNAKLLKKNKPVTDNTEEAKPLYSMRETKFQENVNNQQMPQMDPEMMGKVLKYVMPAVMIMVTLNATAAMAIYIIVGSIFMTATMWAMNFLIDIIIKRQDARKKDQEVDPTIINPHAKYFKKKR